MMAAFGKKDAREMTPAELKRLHEFSRAVDAWLEPGRGDGSGPGMSPDDTAESPKPAKKEELDQDEVEEPKYTGQHEEKDGGTELIRRLKEILESVEDFFDKPTATDLPPGPPPPSGPPPMPIPPRLPRGGG